MADSVNRSIVITGYDDGVLDMLQSIQDAGVEAYAKLAEGADKYAQAMQQMVGKMDEVMEKMKGMNGGSGGGGGGGGAFGGGFNGGLAGGMVGGVAAGLGIGTFTSITSMVGTAFTEGRRLEESMKSLYTLTGTHRGKMSVDARVAMERIGISEADLNQYEGQVVRSRGISDMETRHDKNGNAYQFSLDTERTKRMLTAERGWSLQEGESMGVNQFARQGGVSSDAAIMSILKKAENSQIWDVEIKDGTIKGFAPLSEKLGQMVSLSSQMVSATGGVDMMRIADILGGFEQAGGRWSDQYAGEMIGGLHQGIANPANEFMEAEINSLIAMQNPQMGGTRLIDERKKGIFGQNTLYNVMEHFGSQGHERFYEAMSAMNPSWAAEDKDRLFQLYEDGGYKDFKNMGGQRTKELLDDKGFGTDATAARASEGTGKIKEIEARVQDALGDIGETAIRNLAPIIIGSLEILSKMMQAADLILKKLGVDEEEDELPPIYSEEYWKQMLEGFNKARETDPKEEAEKAAERHEERANNLSRYADLTRDSTATADLLSEPYGLSESERQTFADTLENVTRELKRLRAWLEQNHK